MTPGSCDKWPFGAFPGWADNQTPLTWKEGLVLRAVLVRKNEFVRAEFVPE